jgi:hypothetical protein
MKALQSMLRRRLVLINVSREKHKKSNNGGLWKAINFLYRFCHDCPRGAPPSIRLKFAVVLCPDYLSKNSLPLVA